VRLLSYNIRYGGRGREAALAAVITAARADVVVFQEATSPVIVEQLARETGLEHWGARRGESLAYLSRLPLDHVEWRKPRVSRHAFIEIVPAGWSWTGWGPRPSPSRTTCPTSGSDTREHEHDGETLTTVSLRARHQPPGRRGASAPSARFAFADASGGLVAVSGRRRVERGTGDG